MMNRFFTLLFAASCLTLNINAQTGQCLPATAQAYTEFNNVRALIENGGSIWQDRETSNASYEVPAGSGLHSMYAGSLWLGGVSESQQLHTAAQKYANDFDFYPGPLSQENANTNQEVCSSYDEIYHVTRQEVICHKAYHESVMAGTTETLFPEGYSTPPSLLNWPAHGNVSLGQDYSLAPFVDFNVNGSYDPENGDYPRFAENNDASCSAPFADELHGDGVLFWIFNDAGNLHLASQGNPIGVEVHAQAWGWHSNVEALNNSTFYTYKIINRSTNNYEDFYVGWWSDSDIGTATDDYVGCDVSRGLGYAFNGDDYDEASSSSPGYGGNPPAMGIDFVIGLHQDVDGVDNLLTADVVEAAAAGGLIYSGGGSGFSDGIVDNERRGMTNFLYYNNSNNAISGEPNEPMAYYNYMRSVWKNGQPVVYGGDGASVATGAQLDIPAKAMFQGDSDPLFWSTGGVEPTIPLWTEASAGRSPSDRRFLMSMGPITFESGAQNDFTMAAVWAEGNCQIESVEALRQADDLVQALFDSCFDGMGCINETALNYDPNATISEPGSCVINGSEGCTYPNAINYSPIAVLDDGSCQFGGPTDNGCGPSNCGQGTIWDEEAQKCVPDNPSDLNYDGCVDVQDFMGHLAAFGSGCEEGVTETPWQCGDPVGYQGYDYATVLIGDQCWFAENLRSENYDNGDAIPSNLSDSEWVNTNSGAVAVHGEGGTACENFSPDIDACDPAQSLNEYGRLYNWHAVDDARGLCPSGWHVPTDGEWTVMTDELGGESGAGGQMKTTYGWYQGGNGTNSSGFSSLPGGFRFSNGDFFNAGDFGYWWSSSPSGSNAWNRYLNFVDVSVIRSNGNPREGFSVRCVQDDE